MRWQRTSRKDSSFYVLTMPRRAAYTKDMNTATAAKMIARRTRKGYNAAQSADLLAELVKAHEGINLASALIYNDYATERQALAIVA